jgi:hypothetical protein
LKAVSTQIAVQYPRYADKPALRRHRQDAYSALGGISPVVPGVVAAGLLGAAALIVRRFRRLRRHPVIDQDARRRPGF